MFRAVFYGVVVAVFVLTSGCSLSKTVRPDQLTFAPLEFKVPQVERLELPNGIRLYLRQDSEIPLVQVTAMLEGGAISESADQAGLVDLFSNVLRNGGAGPHSPDEVDGELARVAANVTVMADTYTTTLSLSVPSDGFEPSMAVMAQMIRAPRFDSSRVELSRKHAVEKLRRQNDLPQVVAQRQFARALYGDHPLGRTPSEETVSLISRDELIAFHKRFYHPNNLWLAISGDFDRESLLEQLDRLYGDWEPVDFERQIIPPVEKKNEGLVVMASKELSQTTILMGEVGIKKDAPDLHAVRVMNFILGGGGFNSRLMREVRSNRGLAYSVYSYFQVGRYLPGPFVAGCETKSASTMQVVDIMREQMERLRQFPVSSDELQLAKDSLINSFIFGFDDSHSVVNQMMRLDFYHYPPGYLERYRDRLAAVTVEDVLEAARNHLHPDRQALILVGDENQFESAIDTLGATVERVDYRCGR